MNRFSTLCFCAFALLLSCNNSDKQQTDLNKLTEKDKNNYYLDKIIIQSYPSFITPSMFILDFSTEEVIFQRLGSKSFMRFVPPPECKSSA